MRPARFVSLATLALALATTPAVSSAQEATPQSGLHATYLSQPPTIDGVLDDEALPWLRPSVFFAKGRSLYYDALEPFLGTSLAANVSALFQIGGRFSQDIEFSHNAFDRIDTGARVYTVNLVNTRTTYQFSKELAVRWIARYDSQRRRVLTDLLGSYDLRPGTVFYVGYGSLYQKRAFRDAQWIDGEGEYLTTNQGLFLKASYLFRF